MLLVLGVEECHRIVLSFMNLRSMLNYLTTTSGLGRLSQLPDCGLQSLTFSSFFNQSIEFQLPSSLLDLTFGEDFNMSLDNVALPRNLQHLTFGFQFNKRIQNVALPSGLKTLAFGDMFNWPVWRLPEQCPCLKDVIFGHAFNRPLPGFDQMQELQRVYFGLMFNQEHIRWLHNSASLRVLQVTPWVCVRSFYVCPAEFGHFKGLHALLFSFCADFKDRNLATSDTWLEYLHEVERFMKLLVPNCHVSSHFHGRQCFARPSRTRTF